MSKMFRPKTRSIQLLWEIPSVGFHRGEDKICLDGHVAVWASIQEADALQTVK